MDFTFPCECLIHITKPRTGDSTVPILQRAHRDPEKLSPLARDTQTSGSTVGLQLGFLLQPRLAFSPILTLLDHCPLQLQVGDSTAAGYDVLIAKRLMATWVPM